MILLKVRIEFTYKTQKGTETVFFSEEMEVAKAVLLAEDIEKTGRLKSISFVDQQDTTWMLKELKKYLKGVETEPHNVTIYFDGGFDLGTKQSGLGCVIYYDQNGKSYRLRKNALVDQLETNNEAEYAALNFALQEVESLAVHHLPIKIVGDSQVVINQLKGEWPVYEEVLSSWADRVDKKIADLGLTPQYELITRKGNQEADHLASQALKEIEIMGTIERTEK